jgi:LacI family transcriptional regulator
MPRHPPPAASQEAMSPGAFAEGSTHVRPTIKDVARIAGVHFTTVSMALRGDPRLPAKTRESIVAVAARIGYRRDEVFSALTEYRRKSTPSQHTPVIAYITNCSPENGLFRTAHHRRMVMGAKRQAAAMGYKFELLSVDQGQFTSQTLQRYLAENRIGGIVVGAFRPGRANLELDCRDICVVMIESRHIELLATFVSYDQMQGVRLAFRKIRQLGYRRIGLAVGEMDELKTDDLHLSGYLLEQAGVPKCERVPPLLFPLGTSGMEPTATLLGHWIRNHRVDAVLCNWTNIRRMIRSAAFRCPDEVACACLCLAQPLASLAGVVAPYDLIGRRAVAMLANLMQAEERGTLKSPTNTYVQGEWHDGTSAVPRR